MLIQTMRGEVSADKDVKIADMRSREPDRRRSHAYKNVSGTSSEDPRLWSSRTASRSKHGRLSTPVRLSPGSDQQEGPHDTSHHGCHCQLSSEPEPRLQKHAIHKVNIVQTLGYDASVMNGLNILPSYTEYFHLNTATTGLNTAAAWIGDVLACFIMQPVTDHFGRKKGIMLSAIVCFIGVILQAASQNIAMFVASRIIVGLGAQLSSSAAPALLGELLPAVTRGRVLGIFFSCFYVGSLLVSIINYGSQNIPSTWAWRLPSLLQLIPSAVALCLLPFIPESPRWLISKGQHDHAREVLVITEGFGNPDAPCVDASFQEIENTLSAEKELYPRNPWREIVATPGNRKRLAILVSFGVMLEMFGNFVVS